MERATHTLSELFLQLGLPDDPDSIERFIVSHRSLAPHLALADAPFWTNPQRDFLRDAVDHDADWTELVDTLSVRMHLARGETSRPSARAKGR